MSDISLGVELVADLTPELNIDPRVVEQEVSLYMNHIIKQAANEGAKVARKELEKVYKEIIRQYYHYETQKYYRHGLKEIGTRTGINLYKSGKDMEINKESGWAISVSPNINADRMEGYIRGKKKEEYPKEKVLFDWFVEGFRFHAEDFEAENITMRGCKGSLSGTPKKIFETIRKRGVLRNIQQEVINERMKEISIKQCAAVVLNNILKNRK